MAAQQTSRSQSSHSSSLKHIMRMQSSSNILVLNQINCLAFISINTELFRYPHRHCVETTSLNKAVAGMKKCPQSIYSQISSSQLRWVPEVRTVWVLLPFLFGVNDGSKSTGQYRGKYQRGGQGSCWNYGQFVDSLKVYNSDKFTGSIRQTNN